MIAELPRVCSDETAAVEWFEARRWPDGCACIDCGSVNAYQMQSRSGGRQADFRWRCKDCGYQVAVKAGTIFEDSPVPMHRWIYERLSYSARFGEPTAPRSTCSLIPFISKAIVSPLCCGGLQPAG